MGTIRLKNIATVKVYVLDHIVLQPETRMKFEQGGKGMCDIQIFGPTFSTFVRSVMLTCEELGLEYHVAMGFDDEAIHYGSAQHQAIHPWRKFPVLRHQGADIYETQAICYYLNGLVEHSPLLPASGRERAYVLQWCAAISGYIDRALVRRYVLEFARPKGENGSVRMDKVAEAEPEVQRQLSLILWQLEAHNFICGDSITIADLLLLPMLDYIARLPQGATLIKPDSPLDAYLARLRARPSAQRVLAA